MTLWIGMVLVTVVVLAVFWWGLQRGAGESNDVRAPRLAVFRHRLTELDAERASGHLDEARYAEARSELEAAAALELADESKGIAEGHARGLWIVMLVSVPLVAAGFYAYIGTHVVHLQVEAGAAAGPADLAELVDQLSARMAESPDDLQGWMLLGRSNVVLGRYVAAERAWREAFRLAPNDPTVLANLGEALVLGDETAFDGEAGELFARALNLDAGNPKALWYGGIIADRSGDLETAGRLWRALLAQDPPPEFRQAIERRLGEGFGVPVVIRAGEGVDTDGFIWLFVTLHEAGEGAPPVAARRLAFPGVELQTRIGQADVMLSDTLLNPDRRYRVVARLSRDGDASRRGNEPIAEGEWRPGDQGAVELELWPPRD